MYHLYIFYAYFHIYISHKFTNVQVESVQNYSRLWNSVINSSDNLLVLLLENLIIIN